MNDGTSVDTKIQSDIFDAACDLLDLGAFVYDRNDCLVFASRQVLRFLPVDAGLLVPGTRLRDILGAVYDAGLRYGMGSERRHRKVNREEWISERISAHWREHHEMVERLGKDRWIRFRKRRLPNGWNISTLWDVSDQKRQEEQWRADTNRIALTEEVLEALPSPLIIKDANLVYVAVNKAYRAIPGLEAGAILGRTIWDLVDAQTAARVEEFDLQVLKTGISARVEERIVRADGSPLYVSTRKYRIGTPEKYFVVTVMDDLTDLVEPAGSATSPPFSLRADTHFIPAQNCVDPVVEAEKRALLRHCDAEGEGELAGKRILVVTSESRAEGLMVADLQARGADSCGIQSLGEFRAFVETAAACKVPIDLVLLDDAFDGHDEVAACGLPVQRLATECISADFFAALFEHQVVASEGSEPHAREMPPSALFDDWHITTDIDGLSPSAQGDIEVLVAEDNQINQFVFSQILEGMGVSHRIAENGEEAVALWRKHMPRLILMDISMPLKCGIDAAVEIREAEKALDTYTPIVAVTAQALNVDMQKCLDAGMDDYITKPISPDMIEQIYCKFVTAKTGSVAA
jgi:PAS domain S-box-containing protein